MAIRLELFGVIEGGQDGCFLGKLISVNGCEVSEGPWK
jgi:hypothetical protein